VEVVWSVGFLHVSVFDEMDGVGSAWHVVWLHSSFSKASNFVGGTLDPVFAVGSNNVP
jgi:hypothetical protein